MRALLSLLFAQLVLFLSSAHALEWACGETGPAGQTCGRADCDDDLVTSSDALLVLRSAVGAAYCAACRCDADGSGRISALDALRTLRVSVGGGDALACPLCSALQIVSTETTRSLSNQPFDLAATGDGGLAIAYGRTSGIFLSRFDSALAPVGSASSIQSPNYYSSAPELCARPDGSMAVAWNLYTDFDLPIPHDYDDPVNVRFASFDASGNTAGPVDAHAPASGEQATYAVLCRSTGESAVLWRSAAHGWREWYANAFVDYEVQDAPADGLHLQAFNAAGNAIGESRTFPAGEAYEGTQWAPPIDAGGERYLETNGTRAALVGLDGEVLSDGRILSTSPASVTFGCSPGIGRCVGVTSGAAVAWVFDPLAPSSSIPIVVREIESTLEPLYWRVVWPTEITVGCDSDGVCIVKWTLMQEIVYESGEEEGPESIGEFGRALHLITGEIGPEIALASSEIVSVARARFVSVEEDEEWRPMLRMLKVE